MSGQTICANDLGRVATATGFAKLGIAMSELASPKAGVPLYIRRYRPPVDLDETTKQLGTHHGHTMSTPSSMY